MILAEIPLARRQRKLVASYLHRMQEADTVASKVERELRDLAVDRDRWKRRAEWAEAALASTGSRAARDVHLHAGAGPGPCARTRGKADPVFADIDPDDLARVIQTLGIDTSEKEAKAFAATHCVPFYRGLAAVWFKGRKARRKPEPQGLRENPTTDEKATAGQRDTAAELRAHFEFGIARESTARKSPVSDPKAEQDHALARAIRPPAIPKEIIIAGEPKRDTSEACGAWEPGPFQRRCQSCDELFIGAKDARKCADCAYAHEAAG